MSGHRETKRLGFMLLSPFHLVAFVGRSIIAKDIVRRYLVLQQPTKQFSGQPPQLPSIVHIESCLLTCWGTVAPTVLEERYGRSLILNDELRGGYSGLSARRHNQ